MSFSSPSVFWSCSSFINSKYLKYSIIDQRVNRYNMYIQMVIAQPPHLDDCVEISSSSASIRGSSKSQCRLHDAHRHSLISCTCFVRFDPSLHVSVTWIMSPQRRRVSKSSSEIDVQWWSGRSHRLGTYGDPWRLYRLARVAIRVHFVRVVGRQRSGNRITETGAQADAVVYLHRIAVRVGYDLFDGRACTPRVLVRIQYDIVDLDNKAKPSGWYYCVD